MIRSAEEVVMSGAIQQREPWGSITARVGREVVVIDHSLACGCGGRTIRPRNTYVPPPRA